MAAHRKAAFAAAALDAHGQPAGVRALDAYVRETMPRYGDFAGAIANGDGDTAVADLLSDLMHHCDSEGVDFARELDHSKRAEVSEQARPTGPVPIGCGVDLLLDSAREHHEHETGELERAQGRG